MTMDRKKQMKFKVCSVIREILMNDNDIKQMVGTRIFPITAPEGTEGNFITYTRDEYSIQKTKMGIYEQSCVVYIACVSPDYDESQRMAELVFLALDGKMNVNNDDCYINDISMTDSTEEFATDKYLQLLQFTIN